MNPFLTQGYTTAEYFCDRVKETNDIIRQLTNGSNMAILSPRRMGKTGLIKHCFAQSVMKRNYYTFYVDIYATNSLRELVFKLGKGIFETLKPKGKKIIDNFFALITSLRPAFKLDSITGEPVFDIGIGGIEEPSFTIEEIFSYLEKADKPCVVAIDEFQQIAKYPEQNVEALLRTYVQRAANSNFIFAGSQRHLMQNIFLTSSRPFYQSVSFMCLNPIDEAPYTTFILKHFNKNGKKIANDVPHYVYQLFEGHTWYIQHIFKELYTLTGKKETCTIAMAKEAIKDKADSFEPLFMETLSMFNERQKELLFAIAKEGKATAIMSREFIKKHGLYSAASVQSAARQLLGKEMLTSENNIYQVYDRFFALWLQKEYGTGYHV